MRSLAPWPSEGVCTKINFRCAYAVWPSPRLWAEGPSAYALRKFILVRTRLESFTPSVRSPSWVRVCTKINFRCAYAVWPSPRLWAEGPSAYALRKFILVRTPTESFSPSVRVRTKINFRSAYAVWLVCSMLSRMDEHNYCTKTRQANLTKPALEYMECVLGELDAKRNKKKRNGKASKQEIEAEGWDEEIFYCHDYSEILTFLRDFGYDCTESEEGMRAFGELLVARTGPVATMGAAMTVECILLVWRQHRVFGQTRYLVNVCRNILECFFKLRDQRTREKLTAEVSFLKKLKKMTREDQHHKDWCEKLLTMSSAEMIKNCPAFLIGTRSKTPGMSAPKNPPKKGRRKTREELQKAAAGRQVGVGIFESRFVCGVDRALPAPRHVRRSQAAAGRPGLSVLPAPLQPEAAK